MTEEDVIQELKKFTNLQSQACFMCPVRKYGKCLSLLIEKAIEIIESKN